MLVKAWRAPLQLVLKQKPRRLVKGRWFLIKIYSSSLSHPRVSAVVPKAVVPRATGRTYYKRVIAESAKQTKSLPPNDYAIFVSHDVSNQTDRRGMIEELIKTLHTL